MKDRKVKQVLSERGRVNVEGKNSEYGWDTFYANINMEHSNLLKSFKKGVG
jgi:hypothetical protein